MKLDLTFSPITVALVGACTALTISTAALFPAEASIVSYGAVQRQAIRDRAERSEDRRDYYRALEIFQTRVTNGETDLVRPDPNDRASIRAYLRGAATEDEASDASAQEERATILHYEDLPETDQNIIDRYQRAGKCSESLKSGAPGFYELCERMVKEAKTDRKHERKINRLIDGSGRGAARSRSYKLDMLKTLRESR